MPSGGKLVKICGQLGEQAAQLVGGEQADRGDRLAVSRVEGADAGCGQQGRGDHQDGDRDDEQRDGVRQPIAGTFHGVECAAQPPRPVGRLFNHGIVRSSP